MKNFNSATKGTKTIFAIFAVTISLFQLSCKDDNSPNPLPDPSKETTAYIPSKDKKYTYKITDNDGSSSSSSSEIVRVKSVKDSSGLAVSYIESKLISLEDTMILDWKAYSTAGLTTYEIPLPLDFASAKQELEEIGEILKFKITGFPHYQQRENKEQVGSKLIFKGDPIKLEAKISTPNEEGVTITIDIEGTVTYKNGEAVKLESITTPAGTFNTTKWTYSYTTKFKFFLNGQPFDETTDEYNVEEWTALNVGRVKTIETSEEYVSVSELQKIE